MRKTRILCTFAVVHYCSESRLFRTRIASSSAVSRESIITLTQREPANSPVIVYCMWICWVWQQVPRFYPKFVLSSCVAILEEYIGKHTVRRVSRVATEYLSLFWTIIDHLMTCGVLNFFSPTNRQTFFLHNQQIWQINPFIIPLQVLQTAHRQSHTAVALGDYCVFCL